MVRKYILSIIIIAAFCCFTAACTDESNRNEPEITEWPGTEIEPGLFLYYALSVDVEGEYSFPLIKAEIHQEPSLSHYVAKIIRLPVPNRDVKVTIRHRITDYFPAETNYYKSLTLLFGHNNLSDTCSIIRLNFVKDSDSTSLPKHIESVHAIGPAPFISSATSPDQLYSLSSEFWKNSQMLNPFCGNSLIVKLIRIPEEHVPSNTIRKYECTYFTPEEYGSSADEPDSAN